MKIFLSFASVALLGLAACSPSAPPKPTEGAAQKAKVDAATLVYGDCVQNGANTMVVSGEAAGTLADKALANCTDSRKALMADIISFHQIGHPKFTIDQSKAVAEASIATLEDELRQKVVVTIVQRQTGTTEPAAAPAATPASAEPPAS